MGFIGSEDHIAADAKRRVMCKTYPLIVDIIGRMDFKGAREVIYLK